MVNIAILQMLNSHTRVPNVAQTQVSCVCANGFGSPVIYRVRWDAVPRHQVRLSRLKVFAAGPILLGGTYLAFPAPVQFSAVGTRGEI